MLDKQNTLCKDLIAEKNKLINELNLVSRKFVLKISRKSRTGPINQLCPRYFAFMQYENIAKMKTE